MLTKLIDIVRFALYAAVVVIGMLLYQAYQTEQAKKAPLALNQTAPAVTLSNYVPRTSETTPLADSNPIGISNAADMPKEALIHVTTDVIEAEIDPKGGNVVEVKLLKYPEALHSATPTVLFNNSTNSRYLAESGLISSVGPDTSKGQAIYTSPKTQYELLPSENELQVILQWKNTNGLTVNKIYTFKRNDYEMNVRYQIANHTSVDWKGNLYLQLMRTNTPVDTKQGLIGLATYFGAAISTPEKTFQKITFKQMTNGNLNQPVVGGWAAMVQHYFVSAWIPDKNVTSNYFTNITPDGLYTVGMIGPSVDVPAGQSLDTSAKLYAGPTIADNLKKVAPGLQLTIDYGWFWFISDIIFWMMQHIFNVVGNWGWSIVLVTLVIKLLFFQLSAKSYRSMTGLKNLQPKINALKERFPDDKQKFTQATLELYKKEKVNPMSGCLPILIQIPVFIGLYWVLIESVQLRHAPFIFWIHDLTMKDPYYILPVLMGISMFLQQRLNPPPPDPVQAKVMMFMPVVFTALFYNFPAGLMLYWFVNNTLSFLQQWFIMNRMTKK